MNQPNITSYQLLDPMYWFEKLSLFFTWLFHLIFGGNIGGLLHFLFTVLSLFFITLMAYCAVRLLEIRKKEHHHLEMEIKEYAHRQKEREKLMREKEGQSKNDRWRQVLTYIFSNSSSSWKLAIIEADSMLDQLMDQLGFKGETLGDKLKAADQNSFKELSTAWEVHTIRNRIAHEGMSYEISQHEGKRIIALYERIFQAYGYI